MLLLEAKRTTLGAEINLVNITIDDARFSMVVRIGARHIRFNFVGEPGGEAGALNADGKAAGTGKKIWRKYFFSVKGIFFPKSERFPFSQKG